MTFLKWVRRLRYKRRLGFVVVCGLFVFAFLLRYAFVGVIPNVPFVTFFPVVLAATLIMGRTAGAVVTILSTIAAWHFFAPPNWVPGSLWPDGPVSVALYMLTCAILIWMADHVVRAMDALEKERDRSAALFHELQHRVANTMQFVSGMLAGEARRLGQGSSGGMVLEAASLRLAQLGTLHRLLYSPDLAELPIALILTKVCDEIIRTTNRGNITVDVNAPANCKLDPDRLLSLAVLVAELVTNAAKHAFPQGRAGHIAVTFTSEHSEFVITVEDNGCGMSTTVNQEPKGLGAKIIRSLTQQLGGELTATSDEHGTKITTAFPTTK